MTPYYTSQDIINAVKRKISFPIAQNTFTEDDILLFANEEMVSSMVPSVLQFHEEYFVFRHREAISPGVVRYPVPDRAIGMRLRDINVIDSSGSPRKLTRIEPEDKTYFQGELNSTNMQKFYFEGNDVVLLVSDTHANIGYLEFIYFLRPNQLVKNERAAICTSFVKTVTVDNATIISGDYVKIGSTSFIAGTDFTIGATSILTATSLASAITTSGIASASTGSTSTNIVTIKYDKLSTQITTSNSTGFVIQTTQGIEFDKIPSNFISKMYVDFLQTRAGHKTYSISVQVPSNGISGLVINFVSSTVPDHFIVGDYICQEYEAIIPQIPDDLHIALVERACARILQSIGDLGGLNSTNTKINEIDARQGTLIDNRSEGTPQKINSYGFLKRNKRRRHYGRK